MKLISFLKKGEKVEKLNEEKCFAANLHLDPSRPSSVAGTSRTWASAIQERQVMILPT